MNVIIAGSRTVRSAFRVAEAMEAASVLGIRPTAVLSGGQVSRDSLTGERYGADYLGEQWAQARNIPVTPFPANWARFGKQAGPLRNALMVERADALVAIWDGESAGTRDVIAKAAVKGIPFLVVSAAATPRST